MSMSSSLSNAVSGMNAASRMAEIVSSNVANSLSDGYGRRTLGLTAGALSGVVVGDVTRHVDRGLLADRRLADANVSGFNSLVTTMQSVEDAIGKTGSNTSLSARIVAVEAALIDAAANPSSPIALSTLGNKLEAAAKGLNAASSDVQTLRVAADANISAQVERLNSSLKSVARLNKDIVSIRNSNNDPSSLLDQRQRVIDEIAQIVPIRELDRSNGQVALMTPTGEMLIDGKAKQFGFDPNPVITAEMTLASGGLSGVTIDGSPIGPDGVGKLTGGDLGAAFQARDVELTAIQSGLDSMAADLITRLQDPAVDPTLSAGDAGIFTDQGSAFDPVDFTGLAGRIAVNAAVDPGRGGSVTNLRDGLNATSVGQSGNSNLLQSISAALAKPKASASDPTQLSAAGRAAALQASVGSRRLDFEAELSFANARWSALKEAEAAGGVDTDYEMQVLLRVEQAYAANARVIQTVDSLMQRLLEL